MRYHSIGFEDVLLPLQTQIVGQVEKLLHSRKLIYSLFKFKEEGENGRAVLFISKQKYY